MEGDPQGSALPRRRVHGHPHSNLGRSSGLRHGAGVDVGRRPVTAGASSPADQGVTAKTIAVGLPYVNFVALKSLGVTINDGNFPDAYSP